MTLISGTTLAFASHLSHAESQSKVLSVNHSDVEQSNASVKSRLLVGAPILSRDESGRITRVTLSQGDFVQYRYNDQNQPVLEKTFFAGTTRGREESLTYFPVQRRQQEYGLWISNKSALTSGNLAKNGSPGLGKSSGLGGNCDFTQTACDPQLDFFDACAKDPACFGLMDDVNSFIGNLANWLEVGVGTGATIGGVTALAQGAEVAAVLEAAGLGGFVVGSLVLAFGGGYLIGTGLNAIGEATYSWVFTKEGQLIPFEVYLAAYSGD